jgi:pantothenate kinase
LASFRERLASFREHLASFRERLASFRELLASSRERLASFRERLASFREHSKGRSIRISHLGAPDLGEIAYFHSTRKEVPAPSSHKSGHLIGFEGFHFSKENFHKFPSRSQHERKGTL